MKKQLRLDCSCGGKARYVGSQLFVSAVRDQFREDHFGRGHKVTEAGGRKSRGKLKGGSGGEKAPGRSDGRTAAAEEGR